MKPLTDRQIQVVYLIAAGKTHNEIAEELGVSPSAVKQTSDMVRFKLGVEKRRDVPDAYWKLTGENPYPE